MNKLNFNKVKIKFNRQFFFVLLLVLPLLTFYTSHQSIQKLSFNWLGGDYDPSYAYLLNGLSNACLKQADHIDHPGTPMQVFCAVIIKSVHFFDTKTNKTDLQTSVLTDPEHYLSILTYTCLVISCLFLVLMGYLTCRFTKSIWLGLLIQLSPFYSSMILFHGMLRTSQEIFLMLAVFSMVVAVISYLYCKDVHDLPKYNLIFGLIAGFGLANKIVYFPVLILPFFMVSGGKNKIRFMIFTTLSFVLFTLPVINKYGDMFQWFKTLFVHSGIYGSGQNSVIERHTYLTNLKGLWSANYYFSTIILISACVLSIFFLIKKRESPENSYFKFFKALLLVVIVEFTGLLLTAKHPAYRYLMPYEALTGFNVLLILIIYRDVFLTPMKIKEYVIPVVFLILIVIIPQHGISEKDKLFTDERNEEFILTYQIFENFDSSYTKIYCLPSSSKEAALYLGSVFSGGKHVDKLNKLYPHTYFVNVYDLAFRHWDGSKANLDEILSNHNKKTIFLNLNGWAPFSKKAIDLLKKNNFELKTLVSGRYQSIYILRLL